MADVHSNARALGRVLEDIQRRGIQQIINLGDSVYGPLEPARTLALLRAAQVRSVAGNEDRILDLPDSVVARHPTIRFTLSELSATDQEELRALPALLWVYSTVLACHGTPSSDNTYLLESVSETGAHLSRPEAIRSLLEMNDEAGRAEVILCAHSHLARAVWLDETFIVNPRSVGLPAYADTVPCPHAMEAGSPHARYAILNSDTDGWEVEQVALPYDWQAAADLALKNGRPD
ncbi:metallophosphoesterase family protein (plasmid) [Deinococcus radiomollis]